MSSDVATFQSDASGSSLRLLARISHYEILSRMWSDKGAEATLPQLSAEPEVIIRDFAYDRMARNNIRDVSANNFAELLSGPTVDIYVGKDKKRWTLHRNLLCHHSPYFEHEFVSNEVPKAKKPGDNQRLELPDDDSAGFELFVKWLYQGQLDDVSDLPEEKKYDYSVACHKLYMLCDRFDIAQLKNISIDQYRRGLLEAQLVPDAEEINEIYRQSPKGSPFRKLMTQIAARQIMDPNSEKDADTYRTCFENNPDFAVDMVNAIKVGTGGLLFEDPTDGEECDYHGHKTGQECELKSKRRGPSSNMNSQRRPLPSQIPAKNHGRVPLARESTTDHVNSVVRQRAAKPESVAGGSESKRQNQSGIGSGSPQAPRSRAPTTTPPVVNGPGETNGVNGVNGHHINGRSNSSGSDSAGEVYVSPSKRKPPKLRRRSPPPAGGKSP